MFLKYFFIRFVALLLKNKLNPIRQNYEFLFVIVFYDIKFILKLFKWYSLTFDHSTSRCKDKNRRQSLEKMNVNCWNFSSRRMKDILVKPFTYGFWYFYVLTMTRKQIFITRTYSISNTFNMILIRNKFTKH